MRVNLDLSQLSVWQGLTQTVLPGKHFLGVDRVTYWRLDEIALTAAPTAYNTSNCTATALGERRFALVYVDQLAHRTGYAFETKGGSAVTASCWTSVAVLRR